MGRRGLVAVAVPVVVVVSGCGVAVSPVERVLGGGQPVGVPTVVIVDGSGSMNTADAPEARIDAAKAAVNGLVAELPDEAQLGVVTYGTGTGSSPQERAAGCADVSTLIGLGRLDRDRVRSAVAGVRASGYTPIGLSLQTAVGLLPEGDGAQAVVLVSDGEDTCGVPPCEVAGQLKAARPGLTISTIGFKTGDAAADQLGCIAAVTGGVFVTADNAAQLAARLGAVRDVGAAKAALTAAGVDGIGLGMNAGEIRAAHPDFPAVVPGGSVTVVYRDCDFGFTDGVLESITLRGGGRTIDGIGPGSPLTQARELYGPPLSATDNNDGTWTLIFDADPTTEAAYRTLVEGYTPNTTTGTLTTITLCRCKPTVAAAPPKEPEVIVIKAVDRNGDVEPGYTVKESESNEKRFVCGFEQSPFDIGTGVVQCALPNSDWFLLACWPSSTPDSALCLNSPLSNELTEIRTNGFSREPRSRADPPIPLAVTLEDGTYCKSTLRDGRGGPLRDDVGGAEYMCADDPGFVGIYAFPSQETVRETADGWTVLVGGYTGPLEERRVAKAYFVGTA